MKYDLFSPSALTMFINCGSVKWATRIQDSFTLGKLIALAILIVIGIIELGSGEDIKGFYSVISLLPHPSSSSHLPPEWDVGQSYPLAFC